MKSGLPLVIFSDVDSVLRDPPPHSFAAAASILEVLARVRIPLVLCSGKTRAEVEHIQQGLGIADPFVCENGAATFVPRGYFSFDVPRARDVAGYEAVEFGRAYQGVVKTLHRTADRLRIEIVGFNDMSVQDVARECRLTLLRARLAKLREYEELFRILGSDQAARHRLFKGLHAERLRCVDGQRYYHVGAAVDKRIGMNLLRTFYRREYGSILTVGLADAMAEANFVQLVDHQILVQNDGEREAVDVVGWAEAIAEVVQDVRRHGRSSMAVAGIRHLG
jgi:mannosyl-3-phosphoglycerate phosphatase family protein